MASELERQVGTWTAAEAEQATAAEVEQAKQALVAVGVEIDDDHLLAALKHGCGPDDDPAVRARVDALRDLRSCSEGVCGTRLSGWRGHRGRRFDA